MTPETNLSILAIIISIVLPIILKYWSIPVLRPGPIVTLLLDTSASLSIHPQNIGNAVAHDYTIDVKYPTDSEIKSIEHEYFEIKAGGIGEDFVKLFKEKFLPSIILPPIHIDAEREGMIVLPIEVSVVCLEQKGMISLPPYRR